MAALKPPAGLKPTGRALWNAVTKDYELRPDERRLLTDACKEADLINDLDKALADDQLLITGSQGQRVLNPLVSELRQHRSTLAALLRQLKLPDAAGEEKSNEPGDRSASARAAANARWATRGHA